MALRLAGITAKTLLLVEALVGAKGYRMPEAMMYVRLVHLLDKETRKELMIIYGEDLAPTGFTAADLDMLRHYRPHVNVVQRPTVEGGSGYEITGHHEIMVPMLAWSVLSMLDARG